MKLLSYAYVVAYLNRGGLANLRQVKTNDIEVAPRLSTLTAALEKQAKTFNLAMDMLETPQAKQALREKKFEVVKGITLDRKQIDMIANMRIDDREFLEAAFLYGEPEPCDDEVAALVASLGEVEPDTEPEQEGE